MIWWTLLDLFPIKHMYEFSKHVLCLLLSIKLYNVKIIRHIKLYLTLTTINYLSKTVIDCFFILKPLEHKHFDDTLMWPIFFYILSAGGGGGVDFIKAQYGNGFYKEGMEQDTQLQHTILQGKSGRNNVFLSHFYISIFSLMTTTGTGHCSTSRTTVCRTSCRSSWPRGPGCSTSETGEDIGKYWTLWLLYFQWRPPQEI